MLQDKPFIYAGTLFCDCYYFYHCTLSTAGFYLINCYNSATHFADIFCCCSNSNEKRDTLKNVANETLQGPLADDRQKGLSSCVN